VVLVVWADAALVVLTVMVGRGIRFMRVHDGHGGDDGNRHRHRHLAHATCVGPAGQGVAEGAMGQAKRMQRQHRVDGTRRLHCHRIHLSMLACVSMPHCGVRLEISQPKHFPCTDFPPLTSQSAPVYGTGGSTV